eukprot:CAMPEP_0182469172 /NCGR_PEP_ID=MMETSP1319-20130603/16646_1 /TAXON_ID=172717 /ORGANISM="Bolidomonas pacifica, Strain RCC208" /LENGTH=876 /DNA_ID=CAMNT_0024669451 /DNA_START=232 /DNA_END=2859 /DNA_ORIENTATION=+
MTSSSLDDPLLPPSTSSSSSFSSPSSPSSKVSTLPPQPSFQSLDFTRVLNPYTTLPPSSSAVTTTRHLYGYTGRTLFRWILTTSTGVVTGCVAIAVVSGIDKLTEARELAIRRGEESTSASAKDYARLYLMYTAWNMLLALSAAALTLYQPRAKGSGIPEVKAYLNGCNVRGLFSLRTFLCKALGAVMSVGSGLAVGPEGPLVHLGGAVGSGLTRTGRLAAFIRSQRLLRPRLASLLGMGKRGPVTRIVHYMSGLRNDGERRDFISIGCACGFAAAFGAPIGGVLFSFEEVGSHFPQRMLWRTLVGTSLATFILAMYYGDLTKYGVLTLDSIDTPDDDPFRNRFYEIPLYAMFGVLGGLLGAAFNGLWRAKQRWKSSAITTDPLRVLEVGVLSVVTSALTFGLPMACSFACRPDGVGDGYDDDQLGPTAGTGGSTFGAQFNCPANHTNELASIFFGSREKAIKAILADPSAFDPSTLLITGAVFLVLLLVTFGAGVPSGIFMPSILVGSSLGGWMGIVIRDNVMPGSSPSTFALVGVTALLVGVQRSTVSLCIILMEGTGETKFLIPIVVTTVAAKWVGDHFNEGVYEIGMELNGYPYLEHHVRRKYDRHSVGSVMTPSPVCLAEVEPASRVERVLNECGHNGFPVVKAGSGAFLGMVRRDQLVAMLNSRVFVDGTGDEREGAGEGSSGAAAGAHPMKGKRTLSDDTGVAMPSEGGRVKPRSNSIDGFANLRHNLSFVGDPSLVAAARGNDCKFGPPPRSEDSDVVRSGPPGSPDRGLERQNAHRHSEIYDSVYRLKDDKYLEYEPMVTVFAGDRSRSVQVSAVMNVSPHVVLDSTPLSVAYGLFTTVGLRHLVVLGPRGEEEDGTGKVVGIVTRK